MAYIFLDESGDLGFNPKKKSSKYFVVTVLTTSDKKPIEKLVKKVHSKLRKKIRKLSGGILHAYKEKPSTKKRILSGLAGIDCLIMAIYLNKSKVYTKLKEEKHILYNYVANILLDRIMRKRFTFSRSKIFLIASKRETNKFLNENFKNYLKNQVSNRHKVDMAVEIKTPAQERSLQAVDFVSWSIFRKYEHGDETYYNLIKSKVIEENSLF
ncbi:hypothetical protein A2V56_04825 [Candidatus Woesebacteria bacterium RBG_19FT_COMBO_42_9]|uniref:DUF3800 domain-containing protein n=1 Tax=Candidatus Woesebacteria bacterium RBG_16_42_24 TaxID=1802485 RepID=A0A1F7XLP1_9BACT|nr:MAG: hypothetical protein A2V97_04060 [Candidatus Woesebacteria bacterium RBG_16_42_24]OGM17722.1 MAG: hypothetical protein A2V56_04825 [Candidatus Woesebacteria bacterium RBG_19FT_COMBO_42_9]OGM66536.1 MAG: hypothetical protein A2985_03025 [Candidatus Woesebacteria bacterium RIFCSPLOWO2_01_FULL_43_11]